jgi:hypothetical protein
VDTIDQRFTGDFGAVYTHLYIIEAAVFAAVTGLEGITFSGKALQLFEEFWS